MRCVARRSTEEQKNCKKPELQAPLEAYFQEFSYITRAPKSIVLSELYPCDMGLRRVSSWHYFTRDTGLCHLC